MFDASKKATQESIAKGKRTAAIIMLIGLIALFDMVTNAVTYIVSFVLISIYGTAENAAGAVGFYASVRDILSLIFFVGLVQYFRVIRQQKLQRSEPNKQSVRVSSRTYTPESPGRSTQKLKYLRVFAAVFTLFGLIGLLDIVTERLTGETDIGYVSIFLTSVAGTLGAYISTLSRIWLLWLFLGSYFYHKSRVIEKMDQPGFDPWSDRDVKQLRWTKYGLVIVVGFIALGLAIVAFSTSPPTEQCPVAEVGGEDRNYLPLGTIYALTDDPDRHYYVVNDVIHATSDQLAKMVCFETENEAQEAGYNPDPAFMEEMREQKNIDDNPYEF